MPTWIPQLFKKLVESHWFYGDTKAKRGFVVFLGHSVDWEDQEPWPQLPIANRLFSLHPWLSLSPRI